MEETDHIDNNGLNNTRSNLRVCTITENHQNMRKGINCSSQFKGVSWDKRDKAWTAQIQIDKKQHYLGSFESEIDAARAYDKAALRMFASFACLNFPASNYLIPESITV